MDAGRSQFSMLQPGMAATDSASQGMLAQWQTMLQEYYKQQPQLATAGAYGNPLATAYSGLWGHNNLLAAAAYANPWAAMFANNGATAAQFPTPPSLTSSVPGQHGIITAPTFHTGSAAPHAGTKQEVKDLQGSPRATSHILEEHGTVDEPQPSQSHVSSEGIDQHEDHQRSDDPTSELADKQESHQPHALNHTAPKNLQAAATGPPQQSQAHTPPLLQPVAIPAASQLQLLWPLTSSHNAGLSAVAQAAANARPPAVLGQAVSSHPSSTGPGSSDPDAVGDERDLKKLRRKQSNRESARRSRLRKQAESEQLSKQAQDLASENAVLKANQEQLKVLVERMTQEKLTLIQQVRSLGGQLAPEFEAFQAAHAWSMQMQQQQHHQAQAQAQAQAAQQAVAGLSAAAVAAAAAVSPSAK